MIALAIISEDTLLKEECRNLTISLLIVSEGFILKNKADTR
jgi:hypothetical protein